MTKATFLIEARIPLITASPFNIPFSDVVVQFVTFEDSHRHGQVVKIVNTYWFPDTWLIQEIHILGPASQLTRSYAWITSSTLRPPVTSGNKPYPALSQTPLSVKTPKCHHRGYQKNRKGVPCSSCSLDPGMHIHKCVQSKTLPVKSLRWNKKMKVGWNPLQEFRSLGLICNCSAVLSS